MTSRKKAKDRDRRADADCQSVSSSAAALPAPAAREKRRWSFRRAAAPGAGKVDAASLAPSASQCFSEAEVRVVVVQEQDRRAASAVPEAAAVVALPPASEKSNGGGGGEEEIAAAIKIQSAFRSYLVRDDVLSWALSRVILHRQQIVGNFKLFVRKLGWSEL